MDREKMNSVIRELVKKPARMQEFADLASPERNWSQIDKSIVIPRGTGMAELECPSCFDPLRLIYEKFAGADQEIEFICPHCSAELLVTSTYTGYTNEVSVDER